MRIAITSAGETLESAVDLRFGRAKNIIIFNTESKKFEVYKNDLNLNAEQGAGIQTAQKIVEQDVEVLLTGNLGPKAFRVLSIAGIKIYLSNDRSIMQAIAQYELNELKELTNPNVEGHW